MKQSESPPRRPYMKPELHRVKLNREESLAAGCKTGTTSAPSATPCDINSCFNQGS